MPNDVIVHAAPAKRTTPATPDSPVKSYYQREANHFETKVPYFVLLLQVTVSEQCMLPARASANDRWSL
jgi:hypothetical protein